MDGRQRIIDALTSAVSEVRAGLDAGRTPWDEVSNAMMFYVLAEYLVGALSSPDRPIRPVVLVGGLRQLQDRCRGVLDCLRPQVEGALDEAENIDWDYRIA